MDIHGRIDGIPCRLILDRDRFTLEILDHNDKTGPGLFSTAPNDRIVVELANGKIATLVGNVFSSRQSNELAPSGWTGIDRTYERVAG
jgi:hypothetical protein